METVFPVPKYIVCTSSYDDAWLFFRQIFDDAVLNKINLILQRYPISGKYVIGIRKAAGYIKKKTAGDTRTLLLYKIQGKTTFLSHHIHQFFVIAGNIQCLCKLLPDIPSAASILSANCYDSLLHMNNLLHPKICIFYPIFMDLSPFL